MTILDRAVQIRVTRGERRAWRAAARAQRKTLSELVRDAMRSRLDRPTTKGLNTGDGAADANG